MSALLDKLTLTVNKVAMQDIVQRFTKEVEEVLFPRLDEASYKDTDELVNKFSDNPDYRDLIRLIRAIQRDPLYYRQIGLNAQDVLLLNTAGFQKAKVLERWVSIKNLSKHNKNESTDGSGKWTSEDRSVLTKVTEELRKPKLTPKQPPKSTSTPIRPVVKKPAPMFKKSTIDFSSMLESRYKEPDPIPEVVVPKVPGSLVATLDAPDCIIYLYTFRHFSVRYLIHKRETRDQKKIRWLSQKCHPSNISRLRRLAKLYVSLRVSSKFYFNTQNVLEKQHGYSKLYLRTFPEKQIRLPRKGTFLTLLNSYGKRHVECFTFKSFITTARGEKFRPRYSSFAF